jgi:hypothetical protein
MIEKYEDLNESYVTAGAGKGSSKGSRYSVRFIRDI